MGALINIGGPHGPVPRGASAVWDVPASCCPLSGCISVTFQPQAGSPCKEQPPCLSPTTRPVSFWNRGLRQRYSSGRPFTSWTHVEYSCDRLHGLLMKWQHATIPA